MNIIQVLVKHFYLLMLCVFCSFTFFIKLFTISGSFKVLKSPNCSSPIAIFLRTLLIIFPERVLGNPGVTMTTSGTANAPICLRTSPLSSIVVLFLAL
jgi:hypothetical protein